MRLPAILSSLVIFAVSAFAGVAEDNVKLPDYAKFQALLKSKDNLTWVVTGDSITHGALHTKGARCYAEHFNERVRWELGRKNDVFINTGVSGEKADGLLAAFDFRVARFKPDFVSINLGMNDCGGGEKNLVNFRSKMGEMIKRIREMKAVPVLHVPNPVVQGNSRAKNLPAYCEAIRELAKAESVLLVDHLIVFDAKSGNENVAPKAWMNDAIHPNGVGQAEMAKTMFRDLGFFDPKSATCRLGDK